MKIKRLFSLVMAAAALFAARPDVATARKALADWLENIRIESCTPQTSYIESIKLKAPASTNQ